MEYKNYKILGRFIHGSENSTDLDVMYQFDKMPNLDECKEFCSSDPSENRNIFVMGEDETMSNCYKGSVDETNNALFFTYGLHRQEYELPIKFLKNRNVFLKAVRSSRVILSHISRSQYRDKVKESLRSNWTTRIKIMENIDLSTIDFSTSTKNMAKEDVIKTIAFQIGQTLALFENNEIFTKNGSISYDKSLEKFINRNELNEDDYIKLNEIFHNYVNTISSIQYSDISDDIVMFKSEESECCIYEINLRTEKEI